ncbi:hemerythrin domain-containing protein [Sphaerisporangium corydalis]|uniref:Hemerythrin domain-containing protein n=1 Tax=Sphaerisporangium corydalis TaxID=1441875 RepID=A0ABV9ESX7_9ACTN|nr:hemerythrin domain-containing protein [Sphaerisporangium corydalis]
MTDIGQVDDAPGRHLVEELKWVHGMLRHDLRICQELAGQISAGAPAGDVGAAVRSLRTRSPLWQLRVNCLRYCQVVHAHHGIEDIALFPALRRSDPKLGPTVDRLEADHRKVSDLLDQVESLADLLSGDSEGDTDETRKRLSTALTDLGAHLLEHLDFEEKAISPTLRQWRGWPL